MTCYIHRICSMLLCRVGTMGGYKLIALLHMKSEQTIVGYLPDDRPPVWQSIIYGLQHVITMFPATVLVGLISGFHTSTVLLGSGLATIAALLLSKKGIGKFIPLYYGSSFGYIAAYLAISNAEFGVPASDEIISQMQTGIVVTGILNIFIGLIIFKVGKEVIDKILPPIVTGPVAAVIGFALAYAALDMAFANWPVALITLVSTILFSVYLRDKGFFGMLPVLLGGAVGYIASIPLGLIDLTPISEASLLVMPHITLPALSGPMLATAIFSISIMAIATIPESTAHLYQVSLYVDRLAEQKKQKKPKLEKYVGLNLVFDGIGDFVSGMFGGPAGTNYGENNSVMAITRNYSGYVLLIAGMISVVLAFVGKLTAAVNTIPVAVTGGLAIYLFGVIGMQGIALIQQKKVNLFEPKNLAIGAVILVIGIGGNIGFEGGFLPIPLLESVFPNGWPAIATSAVLGILLNAIFLVFKPPVEEAPLD